MVIRIYLVLLAVVCSTALFGQSADSIKSQNFEVKTDREAEYPGGDRALVMYVYSNAPYSDEAIEARAEGTVMLSFNVNTDSTLTDFVVLQDTSPKCGPAVVELMKTLKFIPAIESGILVRRQKIISLMVRAH